ncbi:MAG: SurA N-terminal domain-containing protein [Sandaracinaceae bacterium]|nr:SurA N-terminal domain-containing protein [Sandaracinaceae bacterium]
MRAWLVVSFLFGCGGPSGPSAPQVASEVAAPRPDARDGIALRFGCTIVTERQLELEIARGRAAGLSDSDARERARHRALVRRMGEERHVVVTPDEVERALASVAAQNGLDDAGLRRAVVEQGLTWELYVEDVREQLLEMKVGRLLAQVSAEDADAELACRGGGDRDRVVSELFEARRREAFEAEARRLERLQPRARFGGCDEADPQDTYPQHR